MQEAKFILNSKLTHGNKGVNFVTSFRADQGDCWMHVPFKAQLELLDDDVTALVYATTARDGSGPLRASFITMLLLEDTITTAMQPHGVCSGDATVTVYRKLDLFEPKPDTIYCAMVGFAQLAATLLAKRGIGLPDVMPFDDRDTV